MDSNHIVENVELNLTNTLPNYGRVTRGNDAANLIPLAYGKINYTTGTLVGNTANATAVKNGPGNYIVNINPGSYNSTLFEPIANITLTRFANAPYVFISFAKVGPSSIQIILQTAAGAFVDAGDLSFIIYNIR